MALVVVSAAVAGCGDDGASVSAPPKPKPTLEQRLNAVCDGRAVSIGTVPGDYYGNLNSDRYAVVCVTGRVVVVDD